ncbi:hypothetical protein E4T56_gene5114 [Termitomyces sp. T112]|nr:hypothetical protein E4T56_gene5114 [Termitomyces sp. T112]
MIPTRIRYASNLLSRNGPNVYRQIVRPKVLHSRFKSTDSGVQPWLNLGALILRGSLWNFCFVIGFLTAGELVGSYFKAKKVVANTKETIEDVKTYAKDTKQEVKGIIEDTRGDHHEMADRLVDLAKEKKRKWQARKDVQPDDEVSV